MDGETGLRHDYRELLNASLQVNVFLAAHGFGHGDMAGAVLRNCWEFGALLLGCASRGGCLSGASPLFTTRRFASST